MSEQARLYFLVVSFVFSFGCVGFSLVAASRGHSLQLQRTGFSLRGPLLLRSTGGFRAHGLAALAPWLPGSLAVGHRLTSCGTWLSCTTARGIFSDQGLNPCLLHWQMDSLPLSHQRNPRLYTFTPSIQQYKLGGFSQ